MPIQFQVWERRDNADRNALANAALDLCRATRATDGIRSARFYWNGADAVVFLTDGERQALNDLGDGAKMTADQARAVFTLSDQARATESRRLAEPGAGAEIYQRAGR